MTRDELYTFVTGLLDGYQMDTDLFYSFLDIAQTRREGQRPWVILRAEDSTISLSTGNTYLTQNTMPTDFRRWYSRYPVALVDSSGNLAGNPLEVPLAMKVNYRMDNTRFYVDYANRAIYFCGSVAQPLTAHLFYIKKTTKISAAAGNTWAFDAYDDAYVKMLGFDVAVMWKLGVDYDIINNAQGNANAAAANAIYEAMAEWDNELQLATVQGAAYGQATGGVLATPSGGRLSPDVL